MHTFQRVLSSLGALLAVGLVSAVLPAPAQAQYKGQAYILRLDAGAGVAGLLGLGVGATINEVNLPKTGGGPFNGAQNGINLNLGSGRVTSGTISSSTQASGGHVTSNAQVTGINALPNFSSLLPTNLSVLGGVLGNVNLPGIAQINLNVGFLNVSGSLLSANLIQAHAEDGEFTNPTGFSNIVGLSALGNVIAADGTIGQRIPIIVAVTLTGTVGVTLPIVGNVGVNLAGSTNVEIGEIIINEQFTKLTQPQEITVNAAHVRLYPEVDLPNLTLTGNVPIVGTAVSLNVDLPKTNILGVTAGTDLIISSATAGAAPEPGSLALLGIGGVSMIGIVLRRKQPK